MNVTTYDRHVARVAMLQHAFVDPIPLDTNLQQKKELRQNNVTQLNHGYLGANKTDVPPPQIQSKKVMKTF